MTLFFLDWGLPHWKRLHICETPSPNLEGFKWVLSLTYILGCKNISVCRDPLGVNMFIWQCSQRHGYSGIPKNESTIIFSTTHNPFNLCDNSGNRYGNIYSEFIWVCCYPSLGHYLANQFFEWNQDCGFCIIYGIRDSMPLSK